MQRRSFLKFIPLPVLAQTGRGKTTAERLGYGPDEKLLMVHADDVGMCHSVNMASTEALLGGGVQSASIMMPCPWVSEIAETARAKPELDLGLQGTAGPDPDERWTIDDREDLRDDDLDVVRADPGRHDGHALALVLPGGRRELPVAPLEFTGLEA